MSRTRGGRWLWVVGVLAGVLAADGALPLAVTLDAQLSNGQWTATAWYTAWTTGWFNGPHDIRADVSYAVPGQSGLVVRAQAFPVDVQNFRLTNLTTNVGRPDYLGWSPDPASPRHACWVDFTVADDGPVAPPYRWSVAVSGALVAEGELSAPGPVHAVFPPPFAMTTGGYLQSVQVAVAESYPWPQDMQSSQRLDAASPKVTGQSLVLEALPGGGHAAKVGYTLTDTAPLSAVSLVVIDLYDPKLRRVATVTTAPFARPDRSAAEDESEDDATKPGKFIWRNTGDRDDDGIPDFADGFNAFPDDTNDDLCANRQFVPLIVQAPYRPAGWPDRQFRLVYSGSDPHLVLRDGQPGAARYTPAPGKLRVWRKNAGVARDPRGVADGGDYVTPGVWLTGDQLGLFQDGRAQLLYVECLEFSQTLGDLTIAIEELSGGPSDRVRLTCSPLVAFDVLPGEEYVCSADLARFTVGASIEYAPDEDRRGHRLPFSGASVAWQIASGSGGTLAEPASSTMGRSGLAATELHTATLAGSSYTVTGTLADIPLARYLTPRSATTAALTVLPGEPASIALATSKTNYAADERDTTTITATIRDGAGNLVTDGTPVRWELRTSISDFVSTQDQTATGQAVAVLRAPLTSDEQQTVSVFAETAENTCTIDVHQVQIALNGPTQPVPLVPAPTVTVTGTTNACDGTPVHWWCSNGVVNGSGVVNGQLTATVTGPAFNGPVVVTATIGSKLARWTGTWFGGADPVYVIGGQTFTAADFTNGTLGTVRPGDPVPFLLATEVEIEGGPGELVTIAVPNLPTNVVVEGLDANNQLQLDAAGKGVFLLRITGGNLQVDLDHLQIDVAVVPPQQQARSNWTRLAFASHVPSDPLRSSVEVTAATPLHKTATTAVGAPTARVVPRGFWHTMGDVAASFVGADPQTGWGVAASIAGGMLVIGDVGAVAKNLWRMDGGQWDEVNWVEFASSGFGVVTFWLGAGKAPIQRLIQRALLQNTTDSMAKVAAQSMRALAIGAGQSAASDLQGLWHLLTHCSSAGNRTLRQLVDDSRGMARQLAKVGSRRAAQHVDEYLQFLDQLGSVAGPAFNRGVVRLQGDAVDVVRAWLQTEPQAADKLRDIVAHAMADPRRRLRTERACWQHVGMLFANPQNLILRNGQRVFDAQMVDQLATLARSGTISHNSTLMRNLKNTGDGFPGFRWELDGLDEMLDAGRTVDTSATAIPRARTWHDQDLTDLDALSRLDDASASTRHLYYTEFRCGRHAVSGPAELDEKALAFMKHITTQPPSEPGWRVTHHIEFRLKNIGRQPATIDGWQRRLDRFVGNPDNLRLAGIDPSRAPRIQVDLIVRP